MPGGDFALKNEMNLMARGRHALSDTRGHLPAIVAVYLILLLVPATLGAGSLALNGKGAPKGGDLPDAREMWATGTKITSLLAQAPTFPQKRKQE